MEKFDIAVIGAGPGGTAAALAARQAGFSTAVIEKDHVGGICLNWGCIPSKAMLASSKLFSKMKKSDVFGIENTLHPAIDLKKVIKQKNEIVQNLRQNVERQLAQAKVSIIKGTARLKSANQIEIKTENGASTVEAGTVILATGSSPRPLSGIPFNGKTILSSDDLLSAEELPKSIILIGGGAIGVEFASFYSALGVKVTILEALDRILPLEDAEVSKRMEMIFKKAGIVIQTGAEVLKVQPEGPQMRVTTAQGELKADKVAVLIGRTPSVNLLGLEKLGIKFSGPAVQVNEYLETNIANIYAIGDLIPAPKLAHASIYEAELIVQNLKKPEKTKADFNLIPNAIFSDPTVASIGVTEEKAGPNAKSYKLLLGSNGKSWAERETEGFMKLVADSKTRRILGVHIVGGSGTELIGFFSMLIRKGVTLDDFQEVIFPHPTFSETLGQVAGSLKSILEDGKL